MENTMPMEGAALETDEGLIFTVKGLIHPPDRVIAYLRYLPHEQGDRIRDQIRYKRVYQFAEQQAILEAMFPHYLGMDPCFNISVQSVAKDRVIRLYDPFLTLEAICSRLDNDPLEERAVEFATLVCRTADIPLSSIGISGSVMLGLHRSDSDLDFIVRGKEMCLRVHSALGRLLEDDTLPFISRLDTAGMKRLHSQHRPDTPIEFDLFEQLQDRKVNEGVFHDIPFFIRFVPEPDELEGQYGDPEFHPLGSAIIQARVTDDGDSIFSPCRYGIKDSMVTDSSFNEPITEMISFRGRFSDQARNGEMIQARGQLERVVHRDGLSYCRLNLGANVGDYMVTRNMSKRGEVNA